MGRKALVVFAHYNEASFNAALRDVAVNTLKEQGWQVTVSNLVAMNFNPVVRRQDIKGKPVNPESFSYPVEAGEAWKRGDLQPDVLEEQKKLKEADLLVLQFPIQWMNVPAILKGWLDRVLLMQYSFTLTDNFDTGLLKGKKVLCSITTGVPEAFLTSQSPLGSVITNLWPVLNGTLRFVGFDVLQPQIHYGVPSISKETREKMLVDLKKRLVRIWDEPAMSLTTFNDFEPVDPKHAEKGVKLKAIPGESADTSMCKRYKLK